MSQSSGLATELHEIQQMASPLSSPEDLDPLVDRIADARYVLVGEASHGTSEYYRWRAALTKRLITEKEFSFVAVEGDWPDCFAVNNWVKGRDRSFESVFDVLGVFQRWPTWMWANEEVADFIDWLAEHNEATESDVGFYGLDVYSLWASLRRILGYLAEHRPEALETAADAFRCFEPYGEDPQRYARATRMIPTDCEDEVVDLLVEMHRDHPQSDDAEAEFDAKQNAEVLVGAERYYRAMVQANGESWNVRDIHMTDTLDRLIKHHGADAKGVVWEHNTHIGDARASDMVSAGMVNVGQLTRDRHDEEGVVLVGFGGYRGSVIAANSWGNPMQWLPVPEAPAGTHEALIHEAAPGSSLFVFPERRDTSWLAGRRGHRAIGVVYHPATDHLANWVPTVMGRRYDAFCFFESTEALHPLDVSQASSELPDTYPFGL